MFILAVDPSDLGIAMNDTSVNDVSLSLCASLLQLSLREEFCSVTVVNSGTDLVFGGVQLLAVTASLYNVI